MNALQPSIKARFPVDWSSVPPETWRPFSVDNGRTVARFAERELEKVGSWIRRPGEEAWHPTILQDFSLFGLGLALEKRDTVPIELVSGEKLEVKVRQMEGKEQIASCIIENLNPTGYGLRIGLRRLNHTPEDSIFNGPPALVPDLDDPILALLEHPFLYQEDIKTYLTGLYPERGLSFRSTDASLFILPGMEVKLEFCLPSSGINVYEGEVVWIKKKREGVNFGVKALRMTQALSEALGEHFLNFKLGSPAQIHKLGFYFHALRERLRFSFVENAEEYSQVLDLRRKAYTEAGKKPKETAAKDMAHAWDRESRILCAFSGEDLVACVALTFPTSDATPLRTELGFPDKKYPIRLADKTNMIEVVNLCTDSAYRNGDLLHGMFLHIARTFLLTDRDYLVTVCTKELLPLYLKIGFKDTGHTCEFLNLTHHLIYGHRTGVIFSKGLNPLVWNHVYGDLVTDLVSRGMLNLDKGSLRRIRLNLLLTHFAKMLVRRKVNRRFNAMMKIEHRQHILTATD